ncbi:VOC family protein [uncultured Sphaerochaeta sp.]|uniref:VOC family protein n=1 Tax=uncultured Sphaerochaeta sp. TaxID=886478 RepID=UPI002A0A81D0|nr:VOC family protein [uncultured Sphaerochaeta sp.]
MSKYAVLSTNHVGLVVEDLDRFLKIMTELFDYTVIDRGPREVSVQSKVTNCPQAQVEIAYITGGGFTLEVLCYAHTEGIKLYKPRVVDVGHWHLSINIEDISKVRIAAKSYGLCEIGELITVGNGPNKGNQIIYLCTPEGIVIELTQQFHS